MAYPRPSPDAYLESEATIDGALVRGGDGELNLLDPFGPLWCCSI
jgi:hypothetical protein